MRTKRVEEKEIYKGYTLVIVHQEIKGKPFGTWLCTAYISLEDKIYAVDNNEKVITIVSSSKDKAINWCKKKIDDRAMK